MGRDAIVPESDGAVVPADADLEVLALGDVLRDNMSAKLYLMGIFWKGGARAHLEKELQNRVRFLIFQPDDALREAGVDEEGFLPGDLDHHHPLLDNRLTAGICLCETGYSPDEP